MKIEISINELSAKVKGIGLDELQAVIDKRRPGIKAAYLYGDILCIDTGKEDADKNTVLNILNGINDGDIAAVRIEPGERLLGISPMADAIRFIAKRIGAYKELIAYIEQQNVIEKNSTQREAEN